MYDNKLSEEKEFPKLLKQAITGSGYNQVRLAKEMHVVLKTMNNWCNGRTMPSVDEIGKIEKILGRQIGNISLQQQTMRTFSSEDIARLEGQIIAGKEYYILLVDRIENVLEHCEKKIRGSPTFLKPRRPGMSRHQFVGARS